MKNAGAPMGIILYWHSYQKATNGGIVLNPQRMKVDNNVSDEYGLPIKHISLTKFCTEHSHTMIVLDVKFQSNWELRNWL